MSPRSRSSRAARGRAGRRRRRVPSGWLGAAVLLVVAGTAVLWWAHTPAGRSTLPGRGGGPGRGGAPARSDGAAPGGATAGADSEAARRPPAPEFAADAPLLAVVIDDWGCCDTEPARALLALEAPFTLAVIPGQPHSRRYAAEAAARAAPAQRREVILHLPMEADGRPEGEPAAGADELRVGMAPEEIARRLDAALAGVPGATGVSNHRGSGATADSTLMAALMDGLARRRLFFLDSITTPRSVGRAAAARHHVPYLANRLFLDEGDPEADVICKRLAQVVAAARRDGAAVGIGHPRAQTAAVLAVELPRLRREGIRLVTLSELLAMRASSRRGSGGAAGAGSR